MRDYTTSNLNNIEKYLKNAYDSTNHDYKDHYRYQSVPNNRSYLKTNSLSIGTDANNHVQSIRTRINDALPLIQNLYKDVDYVSSSVVRSANDILLLLKEVNDAMERINDALYGVGKYKGKRITANDIKSAGIDQAKCARLKNQYWDSFMKDDKAVSLYLEEMKALKEKNGSLSPEDLVKLNKIYDWYVKNRFNGNEDDFVNDKSMEQVLRNCVDAYELIDPNAKNTTDVFFKDAYGKNNKDVDLNILKIKYGIYTCDPMYRDTILGYLPRMTLNMLDKGKGASHSPGFTDDKEKISTLNLDLYTPNTGNFCSFFHECGHAVDHLSWPDGDASETLNPSLVENAHNRVLLDLKDYNDTVSDSEKLSPWEMVSVVDYVFNLNKSPNVVQNPGDAPGLPKGWSEKKVKAYNYLRELYGYPEYQYSNFDRPWIDPKQGWYKDAKRRGIVDDVFGGMTNSKLCGSGHAYSLDDKSSSDFKDYKDFKNKVIKDSYYHSGKQKDTEFYAEVFEYQALKRDMTATKKVFESSVNEFNDLVQYAYDQVK